ncbi:MAG: cell division protein FtsA [Lachnospiraceae bacterium]|nr:cell division protein FtsA [Lachnospiraceae bacterium]
MNEQMNAPDLVFGLDIGTRNVVGTVGYKDEDDKFTVFAMYSKEHDSRAMIDGQIHDIGKVAKTIRIVKENLESYLSMPLTECCIAAAGRVLETVTTSVEYEFPEDTVVTGEIIHMLDLLGVEKAQGILKEKNDTKYRFYVVGYSVINYYINDEMFSNIEGHKATTISEEIIVTFLPDDVVDGLYSAVEQAGLSVANMTLEPIAAMDIAVPVNFRMLNIALIDVGAGTSDISITKDGSIIAYGMIPHAGDELTDCIVQRYLCDFAMAEHIKKASTTDDEITYEDIMSLSHTIPASEVWELTEPIVNNMAHEVADKIVELNGGKPVSAAFVVGGGGKIHGYTEKLAAELDIIPERVALRGEEVLKNVNFVQEGIEKDPLIVTPVGICLNYYDNKNNFIMVRFNGEHVKLYDNGHLTVEDVALAAGFPNECLFPKRGATVNFTVNGKPRMMRGEAGEAAVITMNGTEVSINTPLIPNSEIEILSSTSGEDAKGFMLSELSEYGSLDIAFEVNGKQIICPKFADVNGQLRSASYILQDGDNISFRNYYTVSQLADFMDVTIDETQDIIVNGKIESLDTRVYENFSVSWTVASYERSNNSTDLMTGYEFGEEASDAEPSSTEVTVAEENAPAEGNVSAPAPSYEESASYNNENESYDYSSEGEEEDSDYAEEEYEEGDYEEGEEGEEPEEPKEEPIISVSVIVNGETVTMNGKSSYVFIDVFDYIDFDLSDSRGRSIVTKINNAPAAYTQVLNPGDVVDIYWQER